MIKRFIAAVSATGGAAVGYVLGARAGRERYESIVKVGQGVADSSMAHSAGAVVQDQVGKVGSVVKSKVSRSDATDDTASVPDREILADTSDLDEVFAGVDGDQPDGHHDQAHDMDEGANAVGEAWAESITADEHDLEDAERSGH